MDLSSERNPGTDRSPTWGPPEVWRSTGSQWTSPRPWGYRYYFRPPQRSNLPTPTNARAPPCSHSATVLLTTGAVELLIQREIGCERHRRRMPGDCHTETSYLTNWMGVHTIRL